MSSRHRSRRRDTRQQQWTEWAWNEEYKCDVRSRVNDALAGGREWDYRYPTETAPPDVPRYTPPAPDQLETPRQTSHSPPESYTFQRGDDLVADLSRSFESTSLTDYSGDKGKQPAYSTTSWQPDVTAPSFSQGGYSQQTMTAPQYDQSNRYNSQNYYSAPQRYPQGQAQLGYIQENEHTQEDEQNADDGAFRNQYDGASYHAASLSNNYAANSYSTPSSSQWGSNYGKASSQPTDPNHIVGNENQRALDADFKLHYSKEFKFMRVFKMVWHETRGENNTFGTDTIYGKFKQPVNASIRRFVIIKADKGHCLCLPILTYNKQATTKRGLIVQHHGIIYTGKHAPSLQPGEQPLIKPSVRMNSRKEKDTLHPASRINYAKIYTVEHNVKCVFIGSIDDAHHDRLIHEYNQTLRL